MRHLLPTSLFRGRLCMPAIAACIVALSACTTTGNSFDSSSLRFIVPGQTTLAEASSLLKSSPTDTYRQHDGSALARWSHKASVVTDAIYFNQELWLAFGPDGRFQRVEKSVNLPRADMYDSGVRVDTQASAVQPVTPTSSSVPAASSYKPAVSYPLSQ